MDNIEELNSRLDGRAEEDFDLAPLTGYKIGGPAKYYFVEDLNSGSGFLMS